MLKRRLVMISFYHLGGLIVGVFSIEITIKNYGKLALLQRLIGVPTNGSSGLFQTWASYGNIHLLYFFVSYTLVGTFFQYNLHTSKV